MSDAAPAGKSRAAIDLEAFTVPELTALIETATAKRAEKLEGAKAALLVEFREKAAALGVTLEAVTAAPPGAPTRGRRPRRDAGDKVAAKFRGPNGEEWSGRGRLPKWLQAQEAEGRKRDEFRV